MMLPAGSCDCHCHIYGPFDRFPPGASTNYAAPAASTVEDLFALWHTLGIERGVIVHALAAGPDNAVTRDALLRYPDRLRGIAVLPDPAVPDATLDDLTAAGFRGMRLNLLRQGGRQLYAGGAGLATLEALAPRIAERGWHAQVWIEAGDLAEIAPRLDALGLDVVIDHMGRVMVDKGVGYAGFQWLCDRLRGGRFWCKLSGADRNTIAGPPYADTRPFMRALVEANPDRVVWGTDWPHVGHSAATRPDAAALAAMLRSVVPEPALLQRIMVTNPARLYGFAPPQTPR